MATKPKGIVLDIDKATVKLGCILPLSGFGKKGESVKLGYTKEEKKQYVKYHIVLALDSSGSMQLNTSDGKCTRWEATVNSARHLIQSRVSRGEKDLFSIVLFNDEANPVCESQPLWKDKFTPKFAHMQAGTHFGKALKECHKLVAEHSQGKHSKSTSAGVSL